MAAEQSKQQQQQPLEHTPKAASGTEEPADQEAVDESSDVDGDFAQLQKVMSQKRRAAKGNPELRLKKALPFPFLPNIRPLTISDQDSCVRLENAAFPQPEHRASPEKFRYRLTTCPELSLGVFCTVVPNQAKGWNIPTLASARPVETDRADGAVSVLLAHIVSTRCKGDTVSDADMNYPKDWRARKGRSAQDAGHQESGRTVALHSLAVLPELQGCGIGRMIMKAYLQQIQNAGLAERVALICQDYLVSYYERFGYKSLGPSKAQFGGGGWTDMVFEL